MSFGARHFTTAPSPLKVPASAFHSNFNCSIGVSWSCNAAVRVISVSTSTRSELAEMESIMGAMLTEGPVDGGRVDGDWETGVGLLEDPPQPASRQQDRTNPHAAATVATCRW